MGSGPYRHKDFVAVVRSRFERSEVEGFIGARDLSANWAGQNFDAEPPLRITSAIDRWRLRRFQGRSVDWRVRTETARNWATGLRFFPAVTKAECCWRSFRTAQVLESRRLRTEYPTAIQGSARAPRAEFCVRFDFEEMKQADIPVDPIQAPSEQLISMARSWIERAAQRARNSKSSRQSESEGRRDGCTKEEKNRGVQAHDTRGEKNQERGDRDHKRAGLRNSRPQASGGRARPARQLSVELLNESRALSGFMLFCKPSLERRRGIAG